MIQLPHSRFALVCNGRWLGFQPSAALWWSAKVIVGAFSTGLGLRLRSRPSLRRALPLVAKAVPPACLCAPQADLRPGQRDDVAGVVAVLIVVVGKIQLLTRAAN